MNRRWRWILVWTSLLILVVSVSQYYQGTDYASSIQSGEAVPVQGGWGSVSSTNDVTLLSRIIAGEARGESYIGQVAVGAVVLNRVKSPSFPNSIAGVVYQPRAFASVAEGQIYLPVPATSRKAAYDALNGWDPSYGALFFWNPSKPVSRWIWTRRIINTIGKHVFGI